MGQAGSKQEMFWEACGFGRAHLVEKFIEHGIDVNWVSSIHACSPIHVASQGKPEVVRLLINAGCDLTVQDARGNTAVHHAAMKGHAEIIQMLADAGADLNAQEKSGWTPLHCASYYGFYKAVEILTKNGCDVNILNKDGRSALGETARSKNPEERVLGLITKMLVIAGCDIDLKCADLGEANFTALMFAAYHNHTDVAKALIKAKCALNSASLYTKWTALHWAADCGNAEMVYLLLEAGADPTRTGMRGETPADRAKEDDLREYLETAIKLWKEVEKVETESLSQAHTVNAQASLDTAKALESLSTLAKNRDILSAPMPTIPALGITSRTDPKQRYVRRDVDTVAKDINKNVFPWRSYSKQASPSPDKDSLGGEGDERRKMFPSQDDKTNRFMDTLAQRISYMTNRIASMSVDEDDKESERKSSREMSLIDDGINDSGLSTSNGSQVASEAATPDDDGTKNSLNLPESGFSPKSTKSGDSATSSKLASPMKNGDILDADIIEENNRGLAILKSLQARHRRSMVLDDVPANGIQGVVIPPSPGMIRRSMILDELSANGIPVFGISREPGSRHSVVLDDSTANALMGNTLAPPGVVLDPITSNGHTTANDVHKSSDEASSQHEISAEA